MLTPTAPLGLSDCDVLFPTDGDPDSLAAAVRQFAPDVIVQLGWGIVRSPLLDLPRWGILSWHHGIMPAIRGVLSPFWAVVRNRPEWLGVTIQRLNAGLDTGQIVSQRHLEPIDVGSYVEAYARLDRYAVEMMMTVLSELSLGNHGVLSANPNPRVGTYLGFPGLVDVLMFKLNATRFFGRSARG
jgi:methionyl-tRNA formyltransferase